MNQIRISCTNTRVEFLSKEEKEFLLRKTKHIAPDSEALNQIRKRKLKPIIEPMFCSYQHNNAIKYAVFLLHLGWNSDGVQFASYHGHFPENTNQIVFNILRFIKSITDESEAIKSIINQ